MGKRRIPDFVKNLSLEIEKQIIIRENEVISQFNYYVLEDDDNKYYSSWYGFFVETLLMRILYEKEYVFSIDSTFIKVLDKTIPTHRLFEELSLMTYCKSFNYREVSIKKVMKKVKHSKDYFPFHSKFINLNSETKVNIVNAFFEFVKDFFYKDTIYNPRLQFKSINKTPDFISRSNIIEVKACRKNIFELGFYQCLTYYSIIKTYDPEREIDKIVILNFKNMRIDVYLIKRFEKESIERFLHFLDTGEMKLTAPPPPPPIEHLVPVKKKRKGFWGRLKELMLCR